MVTLVPLFLICLWFVTLIKQRVLCTFTRTCLYAEAIAKGEFSQFTKSPFPITVGGGGPSGGGNQPNTSNNGSPSVFSTITSAGGGGGGGSEDPAYGPIVGSPNDSPGGQGGSGIVIIRYKFQ